MNGTFFCNKCGAQNSMGAQFCSRCGASTTPAGVGSTAMPTPGSPASTASYPALVTAVAVHYGGFWIRVIAAIIDAVIIRVVVSPIHLFFGGLGLAGMMGGLPHHGLAILGGGVTFIATVFASWLYEGFMESSSYQATLGKMIFGMKVTDLNGNRIGFARATGRHFARWLSVFTLFIGYIIVGFTERKQGLHDMLAGTLVRRI